MYASEYPRFHLAVTVTDLASARRFYAGLLGCRTGRESDRWIDFDFFGHQLTVHLDTAPDAGRARSVVDGQSVPAHHFGPVLDWDRWHELVARLQARGVEWVVEPAVRFVGQPGEQATFFIADPSGNHLEFKAFKDISNLFSTI